MKKKFEKPTITDIPMMSAWGQKPEGACVNGGAVGQNCAAGSSLSANPCNAGYGPHEGGCNSGGGAAGNVCITGAGPFGP